MHKILLIGATGHLGQQVLKELKKRHYFVRALVTTAEKADQIKHLADEIVIGDASQKASLPSLCDNIDIIFSALGKNVSLFAQDEKTFFEIDYIANKNIIEQAQTKGINRFVYLSIYGSEKYGEFELANVHRQVEHALLQAGIPHTIIRPVGTFAGLLDILRMAQKGIVITLGSGENKTNPIHEEDLAQVCVDYIEAGPQIVEVGGPIIYTRDQIADMAIQTIGYAQHIHLPEILKDTGLPLIEFYDQNFFDKLVFFSHVLTRDVIAPSHGSQRLELYFKQMARHI